ncbi:putative pectinesterase 11 [Typha angustifolia]|uniref:putative pectinesterase 11 n=1 Tax=Typha angustifolia TaxID=59011 RepID=UPI003C2DBD0E
MRSFCDVNALALALFSTCIMSSSSAAGIPDSSYAILLRVDQSGKGDFTKIQDAIDSVPSNNSVFYYILIKPGTYREKIVVPKDKPFVTLSGTKTNSAIITWSERWDTPQSPTVSILASDFVGRYLTIQNSYGSSGPAVALSISGDRVAFYTCRFISYQDTLLDAVGRHYYKNCYIEGATDFVCGNGQSLFDRCHLHSISKNGGSVTAQRRLAAEESTGYSFVGCKVTGAGVGTLILGRPWGRYSRVVFGYTYMSNAVLPQGWGDWNDGSNQRTVHYGQFRCYGPGSDVSGRVGWSHQLSLREASHFFRKTWINGRDWLRPPPKNFRKPPTTP